MRMLCECNSIQCKRPIEMDSSEYLAATEPKNDRIVIVLSLECALSPGDELIETRANYKLAYAGDDGE